MIEQQFANACRMTKVENRTVNLVAISDAVITQLRAQGKLPVPKLRRPPGTRRRAR